MCVLFTKSMGDLTRGSFPGREYDLALFGECISLNLLSSSISTPLLKKGCEKRDLVLSFFFYFSSFSFSDLYLSDLSRSFIIC